MTNCDTRVAQVTSDNRVSEMTLHHAAGDNDAPRERPTGSEHTHGWLPRFGKRAAAVDWTRQNRDAVIIGAIVVAALAVRLATIRYPGLAVTNWKEIDYISISRNFETHGFNIFTPQESWPAVPPRVTPMEFPLVPWAASILYAIFGFSVYTVRILPLLAWLTLIVYVATIAGRWGTSRTRRLAALFAAALPLWHPYGRVLFSDPFAVVASTAAIYHTQRWLDNHSRRQLVIAGACLSLAGLLKIECLWIGIPISWLVLNSALRRDRRIAVKAAIAGLAAAVPIAGWYAWASYLEVHDLPAFSVFRGHSKFLTATELSSHQWWSTMMSRLVSDAGQAPGLAIAIIGVLALVHLRRRYHVYWVWVASVVAYTLVVAEGQLDAPYRQLYWVPVLAIAMAVGLETLGTAVANHWPATNKSTDPVAQAHSMDRLSRVISAVVATAVVIAILVTNSHEIRGPKSDADPIRSIVAAQLRELMPSGTPIIAAGEFDPHVGGNDISPVLYYYADVRGWTLQPGQCTVQRVEQLAAQGARFFVEVPPFGEHELTTCSTSTRTALKARYPVLHDGNYLLLRLSGDEAP